MSPKMVQSMPYSSNLSRLRTEFGTGVTPSGEFYPGQAREFVKSGKGDGGLLRRSDLTFQLPNKD
jgi:hypothetical protein